jgi:peptidylprolyl isomerase
MRLKALIALFTGMLAATGIASAQVPAAAGPPPLDPENTLLLDLSTGGRVTIQLRPDMAPNHVERMKTLVRRGFYNGLTFHRVIEGFMAQGGDPKGDGTGGSDLPDIKAEFNALPHLRGTLSAARAESPDSANSQFFLMFVPRLSMDGKYTAYGRVVSGMNFVDALNRGEPPAEPSRILKASIAADGAAPSAAAEAAAPPAQVPAPAVQVPAPAGAATTPQ